MKAFNRDINLQHVYEYTYINGLVQRNLGTKTINVLEWEITLNFIHWQCNSQTWFNVISTKYWLYSIYTMYIHVHIYSYHASIFKPAANTVSLYSNISYENGNKETPPGYDNKCS